MPALEQGLRERNLTAKGFNSRRLIEKEPIGKSALPCLSEKNPNSGAYKHDPLSGKNPNIERMDSQWGKSQQQSSFGWRNFSNGTFRHNPSSKENPISRRTDSKWRKHQQRVVSKGKISSMERLTQKGCNAQEQKYHFIQYLSGIHGIVIQEMVGIRVLSCHLGTWNYSIALHCVIRCCGWICGSALSCPDSEATLMPSAY